MKSPLKLPRDQIEALRPGDVRLYLTSHDWIAKPDGRSSNALEFRHTSHKAVELLLPLNREMRDFVLRMADVVVALATIEDRSPWEILKDPSVPSGDVFRFRVEAADATLGNLPLDEGIELLRAGRELLLAAACSVIYPQPLHPLKVSREVSNLVCSSAPTGLTSSTTATRWAPQGSGPSPGATV